MPGGHALGEQGVGDRQHPACRSAHQEAHRHVPPQRGHRPADRGPHEYHRGQQDRGPAAKDVRQHAPDDRAGHRPGQGGEGEPGHGRLGNAVFPDHAGHDEAEARRLHGVDDQRHRQDQHQGPVSTGQRGVLGRGHGDAHEMRMKRMRRPRQQAVAGHPDASHDHGHADHHARVHRHAGQPETHVLGHPIHRQMQDHADRHYRAAQPEGPERAPIGEDAVDGPHSAHPSHRAAPPEPVRTVRLRATEPGPANTVKAPGSTTRFMSMP